MTQVFVESGDCIPVTVIEAGPCLVTEIKTRERDGYQKVQLGFGDTKKKNVKKAQLTNFEKKSVAPKKILREFSCDDVKDIKIGKEVGTDLFEVGDRLNISGNSKGRGFTGVMKRYGFGGSPATRGSHESFRGGGSIGQCVNPGKVFKGKKMPGHHGNTKCTVTNLEVVRVEKEKNLLLVRGAAPGPNGGLLILNKSKEKAK